MNIDARLKEWATDRQARFIDEINKAGSITKAAKSLGVRRSNIQEALSCVKKKAALHGYSPDADLTHPTSSPFVIKGTSTLYDKDGNVSQQWVKTQLDHSKAEEAIKVAVDALCNDIPRAKPIPINRSAKFNEQLATLYTLTDCHVGMKAWAVETGADWDLEIAERVLPSAVNHILDSSIPAKVGIINILGDFLHFDSLDAVTPQHRNLLDADSRFPKVISVAVRIIRYIIDSALQKHEKVIVVIKEGNHDMASTVWVRHLFSLLYENEPRVEVIDNITPYSVVQHGETMLCFHHGHLARNESLPLLFAASYPQVWGATTKRYCHTGHRHHYEAKEHSGMTVVQHTTIASRDAYAARGGWLSERAMTAITYHTKYGKVSEKTVTPEMLI